MNGIESYFEQLGRCFEEFGFPHLKSELQDALVSFGNGDVSIDQFYTTFEDINGRFKPTTKPAPPPPTMVRIAPPPPRAAAAVVAAPKEKPSGDREILMQWFRDTVLWGVKEVAAYERESCGRPLSRGAPVIYERQNDEEERAKRKRERSTENVEEKEDVALNMTRQLMSRHAIRRTLRKEKRAKQDQAEREGKLIIVTPALLCRGIEWCIMKQKLPPMIKMWKYF